MKFKRGVNRDLKPSLKMFLELAEGLAGIEFTITDSERKGMGGTHGDGDAVDIRCGTSTMRHKIYEGLRGAGFHRIGLYSHHIHVDRSKRQVGNLTWLGGDSK